MRKFLNQRYLDLVTTARVGFKLQLYFCLAVVLCPFDVKAEVPWYQTINEIILKNREIDAKRTILSVYIDHSEVVYCRNAKCAPQGTVPQFAKKLYEIGSITKFYTGLAIRNLESQGLLNLDNRLGQYVSMLSGSYAGEIKIGELLSHRTMLPRDARDLEGVSGSAYSELDESVTLAALKYFLPKDKAEPQYSNLNFWLLQKVLESITEKSLKSELSSLFFDPLKMSQTWVDDSMRDKDIVPAYGYYGRRVNPFQLGPYYGMGGIRSSLVDQTTFFKWFLPQANALNLQFQKGRQGMSYGIATYRDSEDSFMNIVGQTEGFASEVFIDVNNQRIFYLASNQGAPFFCTEEAYLGISCEVKPAGQWTRFLRWINESPARIFD